MTVEFGIKFNQCGDCISFLPYHVPPAPDQMGICNNPVCLVSETRAYWTPAEAHYMLTQKYPSRFPGGFHHKIGCPHEKSETGSCYMDEKLKAFLEATNNPIASSPEAL